MLGHFLILFPRNTRGSISNVILKTMKNTPLLYGFIGLIAGLAIASGATYFTQDHDGMDMDSSMQGMMAGLHGKMGDAFDKEFLSDMIVHHQGAVAMAQMVQETSKRPELLQLASDIISAQTKEIGMMQEWQKAWFK